MRRWIFLLICCFSLGVAGCGPAGSEDQIGDTPPEGIEVEIPDNFDDPAAKDGN